MKINAGETRSASREKTSKNKGKKMSNVSSSEAEKAVVRRNTEEVHGEGRFDVFDKLFADDFPDHAAAEPYSGKGRCTNTLHVHSCRVSRLSCGDPLATCRR